MDVIAITTMGTKIGIATVILGVTSVEEEKEAAQEYEKRIKSQNMARFPAKRSIPKE